MGKGKISGKERSYLRGKLYHKLEKCQDRFSFFLSFFEMIERKAISVVHE